jgi:hypothetical protein
METSEKLLLETLDDLVFRTDVQKTLENLARQARSGLAAEPEQRAASLPVDLGTFPSNLPPTIRSCRVFVLRASRKAGIERHRNSYQRVVSFTGTGNISTLGLEGWKSRELSSDRSLPLDRRWHGVDKDIWHQPTAGPDSWVAIAFHTALESELLDEYWDDEAPPPV